MKNTYRISDGLALRQFWVSLGLILLVVAGLVIKSMRDGEEASMGYMAIAVSVFAVFFCLRNYKEARAVAAIHSLTLDDTAILIRDGAIEQRIPYDAIEHLRVRRSLFGSVSFSLKGSGLSSSPFYGYDNMDGLVSALSNRLPTDRVSGGRVHI
jgi:hypothetical protein